MAKQDFTTTLVVDETSERVFDAINNVRGWWSENIEGDTDKLNAVFNYHYKDVHLTKMEITELVPGKKIVWLVLNNYFSFTKDKSEWKGNKIIFDIESNNNQTQVRFTQEGLVPEYECYNVCNDAWTNYIQNSLRSLITTGKGRSTPRDQEGELNETLIKKWDLQA
jgi:activator of Hsp90 ATPase-like protein